MQVLKWEIMGPPCHGRRDALPREREQGLGVACAALFRRMHTLHKRTPHPVAIVTTHYAQMLWVRHGVWEAGRRLHGEQAYECVQVIATPDRYQGLRAPVVLPLMVSWDPAIMKDVVRANTLTRRAQSELHLFGPFLNWDEFPHTVGWPSGLRLMADQLQQGASQEELQQVWFPGVLHQLPTLAKPQAGVIYKFRGGGVGGGDGVALEALEEARKETRPLGIPPSLKVTNCWIRSESWPTRGLRHWRCGCALKRGK